MGATQRWQERLQHAQLADDIDVQLTRQLVRRKELERAGDRDAGVVDERVEALDAGRGACDRLGVRDVEDELGRPLGGLTGIADGRIDLPPARGEPARRRLADPGACARD